MRTASRWVTLERGTIFGLILIRCQQQLRQFARVRSQYKARPLKIFSHVKRKHPMQLAQVREEPVPTEEGSSTSTTSVSVATLGTGRATQSTLTHFVSRPICPLRLSAVDEEQAIIIVLDFQPFTFAKDKGFRGYTKAFRRLCTSKLENALQNNHSWNVPEELWENVRKR